MARRLRLGIVRYLNARPLWHRLSEASGRVALVVDYPSRLADQLHAGQLDVALIPSVEYLRGARGGLRIVPGVSIAARGSVRSVKLLSRVEPRRITRLALDEGSRTSQALARIWLAERHDVRPERIEPLPVGVSPLESTADAVVVIGDRAMRPLGTDFPWEIDLAEAWLDLTGLPFVFALWVARPGVELGDLPDTLRACRDAGLRDAWSLALTHGPPLGLSPQYAYAYLTRSLSYDLGPPELAGLRLFARLAARHGLAPQGVDIVFIDPEPDLATRR
ncbi:MAG: chorismate dehydratase [Isosphaeraceae bacterium]|jgi:chorismate dehydratase|nr:MAG: chorismate dehydratase [Isosphaeraceae bacterium]